MNLKKTGKVLTSKSVGTGPSSYEKRIYRAAVSQKLRNTGIKHSASTTLSKIFRVFTLATRHIVVLWIMTPCIVVGGYGHLGRTCLWLRTWRWRQNFARLRSVTTRKRRILIIKNCRKTTPVPCYWVQIQTSVFSLYIYIFFKFTVKIRKF